jgi:2-polyprenyl-3-methyl-5-hydroxy-6-metoxy-1,4-benzoquinol methylase
VSELSEPWNHNVHYHPVVWEALPARCERALDVGCGRGRLTRELRRVVPRVAGIDRDEHSIVIARAHPQSADIEYRWGAFLDVAFEPGSFDLVTAVASLHHMDSGAALVRMRELLGPGGVLVIIGLARAASPVDLALNVPAAIGHQVQRLRHRPRIGFAAAEPAAPSADQPPIVRPPAETYRRIRDLAGSVLPGMEYRRHLLWRYSISWTKPA